MLIYKTIARNSHRTLRGALRHAITFQPAIPLELVLRRSQPCCNEDAEDGQRKPEWTSVQSTPANASCCQEQRDDNLRRADRSPERQVNP